MTWVNQLKEAIESKYPGTTIDYMCWDPPIKAYFLTFDDYDIYMSDKFKQFEKQLTEKLDCPKFIIVYMHPKFNLSNQS